LTWASIQYTLKDNNKLSKNCFMKSAKFLILSFVFLCVLSILPAKAGVMTFETCVGGCITTYQLPSDVVIDGDGYIYISDTNNDAIHKYNPNGTYNMQIGTPGGADGQLYRPAGMEFNSTGQLVVVDGGNHRVQVFTTSGVYVSQFGTFGTSDGELNGPKDIAILQNGEIVISDTASNRIQVFNSSGVFQRKWGATGSANGNFVGPVGLAVDSLDNIYVADSGVNRVQVFSSAGTYLRKWGSFSTSENGKFNGPNSIAIDSHDNVYVTDNGNHRVQKFTNIGGFLLKWGSSGPEEGLFSYPRGIAVDADGNVYVADTYNNRVQMFTENYILSLSGNLVVSTLVGNIEVGGLNPSGIRGVYPSILKADTLPVSEFELNLTGDQVWNTVSAEVDLIESKSVVTNLNPVDAPGVSATHSLYIPMLPGQNSVYICPNASILDDISLACPGGYSLGNGSLNLTTVNVEGQDYWVVDGLTGTGGLGYSWTAAQLTLSPDTDDLNGVQEVTLSYGSELGFVSGDRVQLTFENSAGFVLANTCTTPTTDADGNSTPDGSATIIGGDIYEYTFNANVGTSSTLSFCVVVTSPATVGNYSIYLTDDNGNFGNALYYVGGDNEIVVSANVAPSLSFNIRTLADDADTNVCNFGTVSSSTPIPNYNDSADIASECGYSLAVGTNAANGFQTQIIADGPLNGTGGSIADLSNGGVFAAGVESYGFANISPQVSSGRNAFRRELTQKLLIRNR
jgi:sugar lactone lactonase YvrE